MDSAQRKYSIGEKEAWAIVAAARKFSKYLQAAEQVNIASDHNPLVWLRQKRDPKGEFARWLFELEGLNYTVKYCRGVDNLAADYLSRSATTYDTEVNDEMENLERHVYAVRGPIGINGLSGPRIQPWNCNPVLFREELRREQAADSAIATAIAQIRKNGCVSHGRFRKFGGMRLEEGILCRGRRIVLPISMSSQVIQTLHELSHWGVQRTFDMIRQKFYWRGLFRDVERLCSSCEVCLKSKRQAARKQPLVPIKLRYNFPRATVAYDIATLPWSSGGYRYVLVMADLFTKFIEAMPMKNQEATSVVEALEQGWF